MTIITYKCVIYVSNYFVTYTWNSNINFRNVAAIYYIMLGVKIPHNIGLDWKQSMHPNKHSYNVQKTNIFI